MVLSYRSPFGPVPRQPSQWIVILLFSLLDNLGKICCIFGGRTKNWGETFQPMGNLNGTSIKGC